MCWDILITSENLIACLVKSSAEAPETIKSRQNFNVKSDNSSQIKTPSSHLTGGRFVVTY